MTLNTSSAPTSGIHDDIDFVAFHTVTIQRLIESHRHLVGDELPGLKPLTILDTSGRSYTYLAEGDTLRVREGAAGEIRMTLSSESFSDFYHELLTISGLVASRRMQLERGDIQDLRRWEPTLRALYSGRPIYTRAAFDQLQRADGSPFDVHRTFDYRDRALNRAEMREHLHALGYLHVRQVFEESEIRHMREQVESAVRRSTPDDGKSWWSTLEDGAEVPTRINYLNRFSDFFNLLADDPRVQFLGRLHDPRHEVCLDRVDGPMVFIKSPRVRTGLANLLWHKDCDLGGHPVMCPLIQLGIQLDVASAENGQVKVLAGSHRYSNHIVEMGQEDDLPVVALNTEPGDVTLHFGDILHCTPEPTGDAAHRRVLYYKFEKPEMFDSIAPGAHYNDMLFNANQEGRIATRATTWKTDRQLDG